jgi:WD40 repeat protein
MGFNIVGAAIGFVLHAADRPNYEPQLFNIESEIPSEWKATIIEKLTAIRQEYREVYKNELQLLADSQSKKPQMWRCVNTLSGHTNPIYSIAISPDGRTLASGSADHTLKVWNLHNGEIIATFNGHSHAVRSAVFSSDGLILASGSNDNTVKLWYSLTGTTFTGHSNVTSVAFSPDRKLLASSSGDNSIKI